MSQEFTAKRLDIAAFTEAQAQLSGHLPLQDCPRLLQEAVGEIAPDCQVQWQAQGQWLPEPGGQGQSWLQLTAQVVLPLTCQRCLQIADIVVQAERSFRFVKDEATAEALDDECEEDLLAMSRSFNLLELVEDELIMALPLVPKHEQCPQAVVMEVADQDFQEALTERPNPFAALADLKLKKQEG